MNKFTLGLMALLFILIFMTAMVLNDVQSETIQLHTVGTSGDTLEEAAGKVEGVIQAEWNDETRELEVVFDGTKTDKNAIESVLEQSGFETLDNTESEAPKQDTFKETVPGEEKDPKTTLRSNASSKAESF